MGQLSPGPFTNTGLGTTGSATGLHLVTRNHYCAVVRGYNRAGLFTQVMSDCVLIDHEPPRAGFVNDGLSHDVDFQSEDTTIFANWDGFNDGKNGSGVVEYQYKIDERNGSTIVQWTSVGNRTRVSHPGLFLKDGATYIITIRAIDAVGYSVEAASDGIAVDATHPVFTGRVIVDGKNGSYKGKPDVYVSSKDILSIKYSGFSDQHSGLDYYEWALKTLDQVSKPKFSRTPGQRLETSSIIRGLNMQDGTPYRLIVRAFNHAGLYKDAKSAIIIPDGSAPIPGKVFDGGSTSIDINFQSDLSIVRGSWENFQEPHTGIKQYYYAVGSCNITENYHVTENDFIATSPPQSKSFILHNVTLVNGQRYCIKVKAINAAGVQSIVTSSDGFIVDATPPDTRNAEVTDGSEETDIDYQSDTVTISVRWEGIEDRESGIKYYQVGLSRNRAGNPDIKPFDNIGKNKTATIRNLALPSEVIYCIVCAVNFAGLRSCKASDGVLIDPTPPKKGVVYDGKLEPDIDYQSSIRKISANWEGIWDVESRISKFEWCIGSGFNKKGDIMPYKDVGLATHVDSEVPLNLISRKKYYVHLRVTNQAGGVTQLSSDGVTVDNSPPVASAIWPGTVSENIWLHNIPDKTFFSAKASFIAAYWKHFVEKESELWYYKWAIGTSRCGTQVQPFINIGRVNNCNTTYSDLNVREGVKYYVTVMAINRAGLVSTACSDALVIDRTPPKPGKITTGVSGKLGKRFFTPDEDIAIFWNDFLDKESGIFNYRVEVFIPNTKIVVFNETREGYVRNVTIKIQKQQNIEESKFRVRVLCSNKANLTSTSISETFIVDSSSPVPGKVIISENLKKHKRFQSNTESITTTWEEFRDEQSPITQYEVGVGTSPGHDNVALFKSVGLRNKISLKTLNLTHAESYYVSVRATNAAGLKTISSSKSVTIDTTPPLARNGSLMDGVGPRDNDYFSNETLLSGHWEDVHDPESGIVGTTYCIGTVPYGCQTKLPEDIGSRTSFDYRKNELVQGAKYYVTLEVMNGAGLSSGMVSDGMVFDATPPDMGKVLDGLVFGNLQDNDVVITPWNISITWFGVEDFESGIKNCKWMLQNSLGTTLLSVNVDEAPFGKKKTLHLGRTTQDLEMNETAMYFNVLMCTNMAGLVSSSFSDGFKIASQWPKPGKKYRKSFVFWFLYPAVSDR